MIAKLIGSASGGTDYLSGLNAAFVEATPKALNTAEGRRRLSESWGENVIFSIVPGAGVVGREVAMSAAEALACAILEPAKADVISEYLLIPDEGLWLVYSNGTQVLIPCSLTPPSGPPPPPILTDAGAAITDVSSDVSDASGGGGLDTDILAAIIAAVLFLLCCIPLICLLLPLCCLTKDPKERIYIYQMPDLPATKTPEHIPM